MSGQDRTPPIPVAQLVQFDAICDRFERQWREGAPAEIEDLLSGISEPGRSELARQLLEVEFERRLADHHSLQSEQYEARFPGLRDWIHRRPLPLKRRRI